MDAIEQQKRELRVELKTRRAGREYDPEVASALCVQMAELCLSNGAASIACYLAYGDEPDTELFIDWAIENEIEVLLPVSNQDGSLSWVVFEGEIAPGIFGFAEPVGSAGELASADLIFIPALAVDKLGQRLGKGKGYYDRALAALERVAPVVAVVFDDEVLEIVPTEDHDHPVDAAVTPSSKTFFSDRLN
jgi:5-formyltetrahydrofolate cyclo-ligase